MIQKEVVENIVDVCLPKGNYCVLNCNLCRKLVDQLQGCRWEHGCEIHDIKFKEGTNILNSLSLGRFR